MFISNLIIRTLFESDDLNSELKNISNKIVDNIFNTNDNNYFISYDTIDNSVSTYEDDINDIIKRIHPNWFDEDEELDYHYEYDYDNFINDIENYCTDLIEAKGFIHDPNKEGYSKLNKVQDKYDEIINWLDSENINYEVSNSTQAGMLPSIYIKDEDNDTVLRIANHYNHSTDSHKYKLYSNDDYFYWETRIKPDILKVV
jgi:uncharacterized UPF0160 family protein